MDKPETEVSEDDFIGWIAVLDYEVQKNREEIQQLRAVIAFLLKMNEKR